ncbi:MAG: hypothetical protein JXR24_06390 [Acidithiobacillaceae bacterium]|nr:hypothetical protein [Acidithiobacillaceae bacterium]
MFIIGFALALIRQEWHLDAFRMGLIISISLIAVLLGAYFSVELRVVTDGGKYMVLRSC